MKCQKCSRHEAVTLATEVEKGRVRTLLVCQDCFLPEREGVFSRLTPEVRRVLMRASREMTDTKSASRIRPALLYFLLESERNPGYEALKASGIDPSTIREEIASFLSGEGSGTREWVSTRGITPALVASRSVAERLESDVIGVEHLLLGLIESPEPGDPWLMINLAGRAGAIEKHLLEASVLQP
jgi:ATP-dependent Clp protease ATP-binding subunit ClpA